MRTVRIWAVAVFLCLGFGTQSFSRQLDEGLLVTLPNEVTINGKTLDAGEYEIRKQSTVNPVFRFFNKDQMQYETAAIPINTQSPEGIKEPKVVMQKIGDDYFLTQIWLGDSLRGFEFPLPERAKALQRELEIPLPAKPRVGTPLTSTKPAPTPRNAETQREPVAAQTPEAPRNDPANTAVDAQATPVPAPAVAQNTPQRNTAPAAAPPPPAPPQDDQPARLPATASDWMLYLALGVTMLATAAFLFRG